MYYGRWDGEKWVEVDWKEEWHLDDDVRQEANNLNILFDNLALGQSCLETDKRRWFMASLVGGDKGKTILGKFLDVIKEYITEKVMEDAVVEDLKNKELSKRKIAWVICFESLQKLHNDLNKINRPDQKYATSADGAFTETYSPARIEEIKKLKERIEKHENALTKALAGEMKHVYELNQQSTNKDKSGGGGKSSEGASSESS